MPMIAIFAFIHSKFRRIMVVCCDFGGQFGLLFSVVANFMYIANPTTLGFVKLIRI